LILTGVSHNVPRYFNADLEFYSFHLNADTAVACIGAGLLVLGSVVFGLMKVRYAIRIATAEGERNVLTSKSREYIALILEALNKGFMNIVPHRKKTDKESLVEN
jgi:hypothetical protein